MNMVLFMSNKENGKKYSLRESERERKRDANVQAKVCFWIALNGMHR